MVELSMTSMSRAQSAGQSCGQVECRMSILACWFMHRQVPPKALRAERIYPARVCARRERAMHGAPKRVSVGAIRAGFPDGKKQRRDNSDGEMPIALCGQDR